MKIGYIQGGTRSAIQAVLWAFSQRLLGEGRHIAGMVERPPPSAQAEDDVLMTVDHRNSIAIFQFLGPGSQSCTLDAAKIADACGMVEAQLVPGVDLLVLSKFGRIEAEGGGFRSTFKKAILLDIPILTAVNPVFDGPWTAFTEGAGQLLKPSMAEIENWWNS